MDPKLLELQVTGVALEQPQLDASKEEAYQAALDSVKNVHVPVPTTNAHVLPSHEKGYPLENIQLNRIRAQALRYSKPPTSSSPISPTPGSYLEQQKVDIKPILPVPYPGSPTQDFDVMAHAAITPSYWQSIKTVQSNMNPTSTDPKNTPIITIQSARIRTLLDSPLFQICAVVLALLFICSTLGGLSNFVRFVLGR